MGKNFLFVALSIVAVVLVALGIFYFANAAGGAHEGGEGGHSNQSEGTDAEALFFEAIRQPAKYSEYSYAYEERSSSGYAISVHMSSKPGLSYVKKEDPIFSKEVFSSETGNTLCLGNVNRRLCAPIPLNSTFNPYVVSINSLLFTQESIDSNYNMNKKLIEFGALTMSPQTSEKEYSGRKCTEIYYTVDYSKMTVEQMISIGIDATSAEVLLSKQYNFSVCIEPGTKELVYKRMDYLNLGEPMYTEYIITGANWGASSIPAAPAELMEEGEALLFYNAVRSSQQRFLECLIGNNSGSCLRAEAISSGNQNICPYIEGTEMRDSCYVNIGLAKKDPALCSQISAEFGDDCYLEFAWRFMNLSYCDMMADPAHRENCTALVGAEIDDWYSNGTSTETGGVSEQPPEEETQPAPSGECAADSGCVRAGCSTQLCVPSANAGVVTTCEYKEEYGCLPLSSCGCNEGKCGWAQTPDYLNCLDSKKSN